MVSFGPKLSVAAVTWLSGPMVLPSSMAVTLKGGGGGGGGGVGATGGGGGGGGAGLLQPARAATAASRPSAKAPRRRDMGTSTCWVGNGEKRSDEASAGRNLQHLSGMDEVRVLDGVLVHLVNGAPLLGVAEKRLGDFGEAVALHHRV